jgi:hypothetical protein
MIWLIFCFLFIELSNDACFLFFSWTNCLHVCMVFSCPHMCYVAWHLPQDAWKVLRKHLTKLLWILFPSPPPHPAPQIGKQEESKREKRDTKVVGEVQLRVCSPEGRAPEGVSLRVFPNLKENAQVWEPSPSVNNSLFVSSLFPHFAKKKYFHENVGTYKIGGAPFA